MPRARRRPWETGTHHAPSAYDARDREHFTGMSAERIQAEVERLDARLHELHADESGTLRALSTVEQGEFDQLLRQRAAGVALNEEHNAILRAHHRGTGETPYGWGEADRPSGATGEALRAIERLGEVLSPDRADAMEREVRASEPRAREFTVLSSDEYARAFQKVLTYGEARATLAMSGPEREAMTEAMRASEARALSEGTPSAGGFGVPTFLDPSIILTAQGSANNVMRLARKVDVTGSNVWKGVSSAGVTWSFDAEAAEVSDDSPTLAQPSVTVFMARGFIPYSIEVEQDYANFAGEMTVLLTEGYDELLSDKFTRGSGTGEPKGILTALSANTNVRVTITTGGTIGSPDPYKVWGALPEKYRGRANWLMSVDVNNKIRQLGQVNVAHAFTVSLPEGAADQLMNSGVYTSPYMPDSTTVATATNGLAVVGNWSNFVVARRSGMRVELVQTLFGLTSNNPTGQRGFFAYARIGSNSVNDLGFRLLVNA
jgi:HK97 family phage major capsid protein